MEGETATEGEIVMLQEESVKSYETGGNESVSVVSSPKPSRLWNRFEELLSNEGKIGTEIPHFTLQLDAGERRNLVVILRITELGSGRMVVIQYRLGETGKFANLPSEAITEKEGDDVSVFQIALPRDVEGHADIQLRVLSPGREFGISGVQVVSG